MISKRKRNTILMYCIASVVMLCALASNVTKVTTNLKTNSKKIVADNQTVESTEISYGLVALEASSCKEENKDAQKETEEKKEDKKEEAEKKADSNKSSSKNSTTKKTTKTSTTKKTATSSSTKTSSSNTTKKTTNTAKKTTSSKTTTASEGKKVCKVEVVEKTVTLEDGTTSTVQENVETCTIEKTEEQKKAEEAKKKAASTTQKRKDLVNYAKKFNGKSYTMGGQWNGELPYTSTDCSGFTKGVYKHFGYNLPRVARDQAKVGKKVSFSSLQPGDLVFYSGNGGRSITHVALYIGNGKIIHAQTPRYGIGITSVNIMVKMTARRVIY